MSSIPPPVAANNPPPVAANNPPPVIIPPPITANNPPPVAANNPPPVIIPPPIAANNPPPVAANNPPPVIIPPPVAANNPPPVAANNPPPVIIPPPIAANNPPPVAANNPPPVILSLIPSPNAANDPDAVIMTQNIDALYANMNDTPLHVAAAAGKTQLAMEIATLEPSFARKLNKQGLTPMHLALKNCHIETVRSLLTIDPELVRVKGKYRTTLLHYAAALDQTEILAEFLLYCPSAITDLTSGCESALHIAVKNRKLEACKVMLGWVLRRSNFDRVLEWKDAHGNTVLHIAASTNQPEVLKLFVPYVNVCTRNLQQQSCLDLGRHDEEMMKILRSERSGHLKEWTHAEDLSRDSMSRMVAKAEMSMEIRNAYLVVTGLIISVTYQAMLSPPGGYSLDTTTAAAPSPSPMVDDSTVAFVQSTSVFLAGNTIAFFVSSMFMVMLVQPLPWSRVLIWPSFILTVSYLIEVTNYPPIDITSAKLILVVPIFSFIGMVFLSWPFRGRVLRMLLKLIRAIHSILRKPRLIPPTGYIRK